jgi:hypothetical protein
MFVEADHIIGDLLGHEKMMERKQTLASQCRLHPLEAYEPAEFALRD